MNWAIASITVQIVLAVYLQISEWINLFPWNDISGGNGQGSLDIIIAVIQLVIVFGYIRRIRWLMGVGIGLNLLWLALQIQSWWIPYIWGASESQARFYQSWFGRTYKFLPAIGNNPIPDALHVIMQVLILGAIVAGSVDLYQAIRIKKLAMKTAV